MQFLEKLGGRWNISLFHYRNHGADFGRVLAGFEVPDAELAELQGFLDRLGYPVGLRETATRPTRSSWPATAPDPRRGPAGDGPSPGEAASIQAAGRTSHQSHSLDRGKRTHSKVKRLIDKYLTIRKVGIPLEAEGERWPRSSPKAAR